MSENLDLVRSIVAAHQRGEYDSADWADPDIEYVIADGPDAGVWRGRAGMAQAWRDVLTAYDHYLSVVDDIREIDGERVLVLGTGVGRGKSTGLDVAGRNATVWQLRDGRVVRHIVYFDRANALADLGLEE
jgi:ketosteroid isomerase-like protein